MTYKIKIGKKNRKKQANSNIVNSVCNEDVVMNKSIYLWKMSLYYEVL